MWMKFAHYCLLFVCDVCCQSVIVCYAVSYFFHFLFLNAPLWCRCCEHCNVIGDIFSSLFCLWSRYERFQITVVGVWCLVCIRMSKNIVHGSPRKQKWWRSVGWGHFQKYVLCYFYVFLFFLCSTCCCSWLLVLSL